MKCAMGFTLWCSSRRRMVYIQEKDFILELYLIVFSSKMNNKWSIIADTVTDVWFSKCTLAAHMLLWHKGPDRGVPVSNVIVSKSQRSIVKILKMAMSKFQCQCHNFQHSSYQCQNLKANVKSQMSRGSISKIKISKRQCQMSKCRLSGPSICVNTT